MRYQTKTIEELLDLQQELHLAREEEKPGSLSQLISVQEELIRKIRKEKDSEYEWSLEGLVKKQISYLIRYGTYIKTEYQKNDHAAESTLKNALGYDRNIPIVHYRLGFLSYKKKAYSKSVIYFEKALSSQQIYENHEYKLTAQQLTNAHLYLTNAALYIAQKAQQSLEKISDYKNLEAIPDHQLSPLYDLIQTNEQQLSKQEMTVVTNHDTLYCSKAESLEILDKEPIDTLIIHSDREISLEFNGDARRLYSIDHFEMLRYFLLYSSELKPVIKEDFSSILVKDEFRNEIQTNTFVQKVRRLRLKLSEVGLLNLIETTTYEGETAYYFNHSIPFMIIHRSDDMFELNR